MNMKPTYALALAGVTILFLTGMMLYQGSVISHKNKAIQQYGSTVKSLENDVEFEQRINSDLMDEKQVLLDSIALLNERILVLEANINELNNRVRELEQRINSRNKKIAELKAKIAQLTQAGAHNLERIQQLEREKSQLQLEQEDSYEQVEVQEGQIAALEQDRAQQINDRQHMQQLSDLLAQTVVRFDRVKLRKKPHGGNVNKKISKKEKKWNYTLLEFFLDHPEPRLLTGESFLLTLVDMDTGEVLPYNQENPEFPDALYESAGVPFSFDGNKVEVLYYNQDIKTGSNYEVQVSVVRDGKAHRLVNGTYTLVSDRRILDTK